MLVTEALSIIDTKDYIYVEKNYYVVTVKAVHFDKWLAFVIHYKCKSAIVWALPCELWNVSL